jgi:hypothetical protein
MKNDVSTSIVSVDSSVTLNEQLLEFETRLLSHFEMNGLPSANILAPVQQRARVFQNLSGVLERLSENDKQRAIYISKFLAAVASGLFDAALNYLWDETVLELRKRVAQYDLSYFFDNAVPNPDKRKRLQDENDLIKIEDSELINGAKGIGLISETGFKHLEFVKYMRNWASAAHPNQHEVTGLELCGWLERCIIEVISLPLSNDVVEIKRLLANVKSNVISGPEAKAVGMFFAEMTGEKVKTLVQGFFGIYTRQDTVPQTRANIHLLLPLLWDRVDEETRGLLGLKFGRYAANNEQAEQQFARQFLEVVGGLSYLPDNVRAAEILTAVENLLSAHRALNNFHNEPTFASALEGLIGRVGRIPNQANRTYVLGLVEVYLTNGHGVAWHADEIYKSMISRFDSNQALIAVLSFDEETISSKLQFTRCKEKYLELLGQLKQKISAPVVKELLELIEEFTGPFERLRSDSQLKNRVANLKKIT